MCLLTEAPFTDFIRQQTRPKTQTGFATKKMLPGHVDGWEVQGKLTVSERVKVKGKLTYVCKLNLSF